MIFGGPLSSYAKSIVSLIMALLLILETWAGISFPGITEQWVTTLIAIIWPMLVLVIPNSQ